MIGLFYCAQARLKRLCKMKVSRHKQSQLANSTLKWWIYEFHILELRNAEINAEIITLKYAT